MDQGTGIPFVDLTTPHQELEEELLDAARRVLRSGTFAGGAIVEQFEREFAQFCETKYCVGVGSGTDALRFALIAAGIGEGDVVVTVPNTFAATIEAILQAGATPHFVDVDPLTFNMNVDALREYLQSHSNRRVKAILPVHLYGQMCDMDSIMSLADEYDLVVIEDACQAHGSEYFSARNGRWQIAGSVGKAAAFSFYPGKNLGACGEAGAVTTNDENVARRVRMIREHGQSMKYHHVIEGYNGRLDALQAAFLSVKLPYLADWNDKRRAAAKTYDELLSDADGVRTPHEPRWSRAARHLYVICTRERDELRERLAENNIGTGLHYPIPVHLQEAYARLGYRAGDFPVTERLAGEVLSLPMFPHIRREDLERVVELVVKAFTRSCVEATV